MNNHPFGREIVDMSTAIKRAEEHIKRIPDSGNLEAAKCKLAAVTALFDCLMTVRRIAEITEPKALPEGRK